MRPWPWIGNHAARLTGTWALGQISSSVRFNALLDPAVIDLRRLRAAGARKPSITRHSLALSLAHRLARLPVATRPGHGCSRTMISLPSAPSFSLATALWLFYIDESRHLLSLGFVNITLPTNYICPPLSLFSNLMIIASHVSSSPTPPAALRRSPGRLEEHRPPPPLPPRRLRLRIHL